MIPRGRHVGSDVSALVDGQLDPATEERYWDHVLDCPSCRAAVESETWVKRRIAVTTCAEPSARLIGSLQQMPAAQEAWAAAEVFERQAVKRRRVALAGASSVSIALVGFAVLSGVMPDVSPAGPPSADLTGSLVPSDAPDQTPTDTTVGFPVSSPTDPDPEGELANRRGGSGPLVGSVPSTGADKFMSVVLLAP